MFGTQTTYHMEVGESSLEYLMVCVGMVAVKNTIGDVNACHISREPTIH